MPQLDLTKLVADLQSTTSRMIKQDVTQLQGFSADQLQAIGDQAREIAMAEASGSLTPELRQYFVDGLKEDMEDYVKTVEAIAEVQTEKLWNALAGIVTSAIGIAIGPAGGTALSAALAVSQFVLPARSG